MQNRAKAKVKKKAHEKQDEELSKLVCIELDLRNNKEDLLYKEIFETNREKRLKKKTKVPESHMPFTNAIGYESEYLTHTVLTHTGATGVVTVEEITVLEEFTSMGTLKHSRVDNSNANTGFETELDTLLVKNVVQQKAIHHSTRYIVREKLP